MKERMMRTKRKPKGEREEKTGETNKREKRKTKRVLKYPPSALDTSSPGKFYTQLPRMLPEPYARANRTRGARTLRHHPLSGKLDYPVYPPKGVCKVPCNSRPCLCRCCSIWRQGFVLNTVKTPNAPTSTYSPPCVN